MNDYLKFLLESIKSWVEYLLLKQFSWVLVMYWNYPSNCWIIAGCYVRTIRNVQNQ